MELAGIVFCFGGVLFFVAGTVGLLRFPDTYSRLHALTKADNLGLGFIAIGLGLASQSWLIAGKLVLIWLVTMLGGTTNCYLMGNARYTQQGPKKGTGAH